MNQHLQLHDKLRGLKKNPNTQNWAKKNISGGRKRNWFFGIITISLVIAMLGVTTLARISQSYSNISTRQESLISYISDLFKVTADLEDGLEKLIIDEVNTIAEPVNNFWLTEWLTTYETKKALGLIKEWKKIVQPLGEYEITSSGLSAGVSKPTFTNALQDFFTKAPEVMEQTRFYWRSLWPYRIAGVVSSELLGLFNKVSKALDLLDYILVNQQKILFLLGHYSAQTIVLFNQNPGEARPTGGFTGSYIIMEVSQGELSIKESQSIYYVSNVTKEEIVAHPHTWMYARFFDNRALPQGLHNMNFFPCFRDSAELLAEEFEKSVNGFTINQLYMITPNILKTLLPPDLIIEVPEVGTFNPDNLLDEIERLSSFQAVDITNPKKQIKNIFESLIDSFDEILDYYGPSNIVQILLHGLFARHIQMWYPSNDLTSFVRNIGFSSDQVCADLNPDTITFLLSNVSGDKRQLITDNNFGISAKRNFGGYRITLKYKQQLGQTEFLQRGFNPFGINYFGFQLPINASNIHVDSTPQLEDGGLRPYYQIRSQLNTRYKARTPEVISNTAQSVADLEDEGFVYQNPDGSLVAGAYINDRPGETTLEVSFDLSQKSYEKLSFYPQPGLNNPTLRLGENTATKDNIFNRKIEGLQLEQGVDLVLF